MKVTLLHHTPLHIVASAIRTCWASQAKSDTTLTEVCNSCGSTDTKETDNGAYCQTCGSEDISIETVCGPEDRALIDRIGNKAKHESVKNHMTYNFYFEDVTTKTLLALTRHDVGVEFSVQSTRYTTKKAVKNGTAGYTQSKSERVNRHLKVLNEMIKDCVDNNEANDEISLLLPQAWRYNLTCSMSLTAVQHFLTLRSKRDAHWDIQDLSKAVLSSIPKDHLYLFEDYIPKELTDEQLQRLQT